MSPTRRDVLKIAAAVPMFGAAMSRSEALAELAKPATLEPVNFEDHPDEVFDPASFADSNFRGTFQNVLSQSHAHIDLGAKAMHEYKVLRQALIQAHPELSTGRYNDLFVLMDEAVYGVWNEAQMEGVRIGAVLENLRRSVVGQMQDCPKCEGVGFLDQTGRAPDPHRTSASLSVCPDCKGNGVVASETLKGWRRS